MQHVSEGDRIAMRVLLNEALDYEFDRDTTCAAMLLALRHIGAGMPEQQRWQLAQSVYAVADQLAAQRTDLAA